MATQRKSIKEAKAEKAAKKRRAKRRRRAWFLVSEFMVLFILLGIGYLMIKFGKIDHIRFEDGEIVTNQGAKQEGYTTIALFGGDSREGELEAGTHADTIMVASIDNETKEIRLVSVYRDLLTNSVDGEILKANSAYFLGGPKEAINMLNRNFDLDIQDYVTVDFTALAEVIDLLGGIEVDVTEAEATAINEYIGETASVAGKEAIPVVAGQQILDGVQAVTYARIRKNVGGDYARTDRQRQVLHLVMEKAKGASISELNNILDAVFPKVSTSFDLPGLMKMVPGATKYHMGETSGFPFELTDGNVEGIGSVVIPLGVSENVSELHAFLYPKDEYVVSDTVEAIAQRIENLTGFTRADAVPNDVPAQ